VRIYFGWTGLSRQIFSQDFTGSEFFPGKYFPGQNGKFPGENFFKKLKNNFSKKNIKKNGEFKKVKKFPEKFPHGGHPP